MVPLMEYILADAEVIGEYFKNIIDLYDGDVTSQELYRDDNFVIFNTCLEQVFECLKTILCWNGFGEQVELLKLALSHFANRSTKLDKDKYRSINISPSFFLLRYLPTHSMVRANLNKSVWLVTNTTTAKVYT